jgi:polysaccharide deacetylase 2 family uncharacterized protein YibQ
MKVTVEKKELVIRIPMEEERIDTAGNGKTLRVASSGGNRETECIDPVSKKKIVIGLNAYVRSK